MAIRPVVKLSSLNGTNGFQINGELLSDVHDWHSLEAELRSRLICGSTSCGWPLTTARVSKIPSPRWVLNSPTRSAGALESIS